MCLFCERDTLDIVYENDRVYAVYDSYPVNPGHALIIPHRHVADVFEMTAAEWSAVFEALSFMRKNIVSNHDPDGFNVGANSGKAAGQTIFHAHIHLIPRYKGDVTHPRGGVRSVIPGKQTY